MRDSTQKACVFGGLVVAIYGIFMISNALAGQEVPDGTVLTGIVGVVVGIGGYVIGFTRAKEGS